MNKSLGWLSVAVPLLSSGASGQTVRPTPVFEVASVKLHEAHGGKIGISTSGLRFYAEAATLQTLAMYAYDLKSYQVPWTTPLLPFGDTFYDIVAKAEGDAVPSTNDFRKMLQSLLAERFKIQAHREAREIPVYTLTVGRNGSRLKESVPGADRAVRYMASGRNYEVTMLDATLPDLIRVIENSFIDRPVIDKTGLTGAYEIRMTYFSDPPSSRRSSDPDDMSIFTAVQKLGLRLEPGQAKTDMLIVDNVEKPSGN